MSTVWMQIDELMIKRHLKKVKMKVFKKSDMILVELCGV